MDICARIRHDRTQQRDEMMMMMTKEKMPARESREAFESFTLRGFFRAGRRQTCYVWAHNNVLSEMFHFNADWWRIMIEWWREELCFGIISPLSLTWAWSGAMIQWKLINTCGQAQQTMRESHGKCIWGRNRCGPKALPHFFRQMINFLSIQLLFSELLAAAI